MTKETNNTQQRPDYLFEISWEVCNKSGSKYEIISSKSNYLESVLGTNYILIGPDIHKENGQNSDFIEDKSLFKSWRETAQAEGLYFRIGYWNIKSKPIVVLVDFSHYFSSKDEIFAEMWESYKLDSISGNWDYIEPALFGFAASNVIENYYKYYISSFDKLVVHFHEWKTGLGILNLKKNVPQAALVFTAHNTVIGNALAYNNTKRETVTNKFDDELLSKFQIKALYSLEKISASISDVFLAVSKTNFDDSIEFLNVKPNLIAFNGVKSNYFNIDDESVLSDRKINKEKLNLFISAFFNERIQDNNTIIIHSCKDNLSIKGTEKLIKSLSAYNKTANDEDKDLYLILQINKLNSGPVERVVDNIKNQAFNEFCEGEYLTHHTMNEDGDHVLQLLKEYGLFNKRNDKVKVIFIPAFINGKDGVLNIDYLDLLSAVDLGVFPAEYEPWGYQPLVCLSQGVNVLCSANSGFGAWVEDRNFTTKSIQLLDTINFDDNYISNQILEFIFDYNKNSQDVKDNLSLEAIKFSKQLSWDTLIDNYWLAYSNAINKALQRFETYKTKQPKPQAIRVESSNPIWHKVLVKPEFPESLYALRELSQNLWWSWDYDAQQLFESINPDLWQGCQHNPIALLEALDIKHIKKLNEDVDFQNKLCSVYSRFKDYMSAKPDSDKTIAYFCMEYGLHSSVKLYSGGLGILAGDYLKEASDSNKNLIAVGLLYRYGYFNQKISIFGDQISEKIPQKFTHLPIKAVRDEHDQWLHVSIAFLGRIVKAKVWELSVGRIPLYLLDTDIEENSEYDRAITHQLYGGDWENRLKQELLLGIGGIRMIRKMKVNPSLYHLNEGHAAFLNLERLRFLIQEAKLNFSQAVEVLRSKSLFTTHTPVPAGHDAFDENLLRVYLAHYPERFNISWEKFMSLGRINNSSSEKFSMSILALKLSQECNGVSRLHGSVSRDMFKSLYPGFFKDEIHISHVTNGVHYSTWAAKEWMNLLTNNKPENLNNILNDKNKWSHLNDVEDKIIWDIRSKFRKKLYDFISLKIVEDYTTKQESPKIISNTLDKLNPNVLTIGFARRFATYKRAHLLFSNLERLDAIVNNNGREVRFIFAGKAHPQDTLGQELIKKIISYSKMPQFIGKIIFLDNYDADIARTMVQGVDIWLNTPTRPLEASGTSGEKAVMNGVLHFSVLDGWWEEGYVKDAGWALKKTDTYSDSKLQDELDAETIYNLIENEVVPAFYRLDENNIPTDWIKIIKKNLCEISPNFTMRRMINDYYEKFYNKMLIRSKFLCDNNFENAVKIAAWKRKIEVLWPNLSVITKNIHDSTVKPLLLGENFNAEIKIDTAGIPADEIGIEIVFGDKIMDKIDEILFVEELDKVSEDDNIVTFSKSIEIRKPGVLNYAIRVFVKNPDLPHRTDFGLIKWV